MIKWRFIKLHHWAGAEFRGRNLSKISWFSLTFPAQKSDPTNKAGAFRAWYQHCHNNLGGGCELRMGPLLQCWYHALEAPASLKKH